MTTQKHTQEEIGSKIKQLRIEKRMTQAELAEKMNVSSSAISKWEKRADIQKREFSMRLEKKRYFVPRETPSQ